MCRKHFVLGFLAWFVSLVQSWDIAVSHRDQLHFYTNGIKIDMIRIPYHNIAALSYDAVHNMMLYIDKQHHNDAICAHDISSIESKCLIERNGRNIHGLAFDPATELLFFTDRNEGSINWISLKPGFKNKIYGNNLIKMDYGIPTDIAVDSCRGYVYWINTNLATPTIERARFNGTEREIIINLKSFSIYRGYQMEPHSLTIDQQTRKMYWIEPEDISTYAIYYADLNGKDEKFLAMFYVDNLLNPLANTLAISKTYLYGVLLPERHKPQAWIEKIGKFKFMGKAIIDLHFDNMIVGIAANYKIKEQIQDLDDCEPLMNLEGNNCDGICVHGKRIIGQSACKCTPGYTGDRCEVSICENYCFQGNCSISETGLPECRCDAGFSGERCQVAACHSYCLNSGLCSLNEEDEPFCECVDGYEGQRCEAEANSNACNQE